jgi:hypothetical protein
MHINSRGDVVLCPALPDALLMPLCGEQRRSGKPQERSTPEAAARPTSRRQLHENLRTAVDEFAPRPEMVDAVPSWRMMNR